MKKSLMIVLIQFFLAALTLGQSQTLTGNSENPRPSSCRADTLVGRL